MTIEIPRIVMPNDPQIVDPETGSLTPAWLHYLGQLKALNDKAIELAAAVNDHEDRIEALEP